MKYSKCLLRIAIACLSLAVATSTAHAQYSDLVLAAEPFAYWQLDDDDGEEFPFDNGAGTGIEGITTGVEFGVDGIVPGEASNKAARFAGANLITFPDDAQTNTGGPYEEKTFSLWFSADDAMTDTPQILFEQGGSTRGAVMYVQNGELTMGIWNRANDDAGVSSPWENPLDPPRPDTQSVFVSRPINSQTAYHAALVMDGDAVGKSGTITAYLDGGVFGEAGGIGQLFNHGDNFGIGGMHQNSFLADGTAPTGDGLFFNGVLDEIAFYNTALDADTILRHALIEPRVPAGDFNSDGVMDAADFTILATNFGGTFGRDNAIDMGDYNRDQVVDMKDFLAFRTAFNAPAAAAPVPEPSGIVLLGFGMLFGLLVRRRR